jgi:hypothetical protein
VFAQNERLLGELRWIRRRLEWIGEDDYSVKEIKGFAVLDEVDRKIMQRVREAGVLLILTMSRLSRRMKFLLIELKRVWGMKKKSSKLIIVLVIRRVF